MRPLYLGGWDVIFKVRCSQGLSVRSIMSSVGSLSTASSLSDALNSQDDELEVSVVTPETVIGVILEHRVGGLPKQSELAYVQTALLYTNPWTGDRRVRVSTLAMTTSSVPQNILPSMDFGALAALQLRQNLPHGNYPNSLISFEATSSSSGADVSSPDQRGDRVLTRARKGLVDACVQVLAAHRQETARRRPPSMSEFLVPDSLQLWPLFVLSALKSPLLRPSLPRLGTGTQAMVPTPRGDERAYYFYCARKISPSAALLLVNPLLFDLGSVIRAETTDENQNGTFEWRNLRLRHPSNLDDVMANLKSSPVVDLPNPLDATVSNLAEDGIYLLDTCFAAYVLIERDAIESFEHVESQVRNAVSQLQLWSQVGREPKCLRPVASLPIVRIDQRADTEKYQSLLRWMVLDATSHEKDFGQFCSDLNRKIQSIAGT
jgi:hypothetical protein